MKSTRTNDLAGIYCNPLNLNYRVQHPNSGDHQFDKSVWLREGADPSVAIFNGAYYLFSSVSDCYWRSRDLVNWDILAPRNIANLPILRNYAPTAVVIGDTLYLKDGNGKGFVHCTETPDDPDSWLPLPDTNWRLHDAQFFLDDDQRLWIAYGCSPTGKLFLQELDVRTFLPTGPVHEFMMPDVANHGWERACGNNDHEDHGWVEGPQLFKRNGRYYFVYTCPTIDNVYANGVYVADTITGPYRYQAHNPVTQKMTGFATGAGHGEIFQDLRGNWWTLTCQNIFVLDRFERRICMFPTGFDEDGLLNSDTWQGDYPTRVPNTRRAEPMASEWTGWHLLSRNRPATASSALPAHPPELAVEEDIRTWWSATSGEPGEWLEIDLGQVCEVAAIQVNFAEQDLICGVEENPAARYQVLGSQDGKHWESLVDQRQNTRDITHDFTVLKGAPQVRHVRLVNAHMPYGGKFAIRGLRVFGSGAGAPPVAPAFTVTRNPDDAREAVIRWQPVPGADGYIVRYGIAAHKLYRANQVYDRCEYVCRSLNVGVAYQVTVDAFNANGYAQGTEFIGI